MTPMQISGLGLVGGFGCGKRDLLAALERGRVPTSQVELRGRRFPLYQADPAPLQDYLSIRALRRIDHFSRLALLGAFQALEDAGKPELDRSRLGLVIGSGYGALQTTFKFLDSVLDDGDALASPTAFSNSVHNAAAAHISMQLGITGPSLTVSQFDQSLVSALIGAQHWLDQGRVDAVLLGVVDEYCSVLGYCWERFCGSREDMVPRPLDFAANTAVPGEGAVFFLLQPGPTTSGEYGCIEQVEMGSLSGSQPTLPVGEPLILGCEGHPITGAAYRDRLDRTRPLSCYTPLYGASPITQGFDLAVAALALQRGRLFPSADPGPQALHGTVVTSEVDCTGLSCLRYGTAGEYAAIHLKGGGV